MQHTPSPRAPLPGTTPPPRGLFVDRWGTLLAPPEAGFAKSPSELTFYDGALDALFRAGQAGWNLYLLGNEEHVWDGRLAAEAWEEVQAAFLSQLEAAGIALTRNYACTTHPEGVSGQVGDSVYRLPNTGAFYHCAHTDGVDLGRSWVVGDSSLELVAGWRAGCRLAAVRTGVGLADGAFEVDVDLDAADLAEVVDVLLERQPAYTR